MASIGVCVFLILFCCVLICLKRWAAAKSKKRENRLLTKNKFRAYQQNGDPSVLWTQNRMGMRVTGVGAFEGRTHLDQREEMFELKVEEDRLKELAKVVDKKIQELYEDMKRRDANIAEISEGLADTKKALSQSRRDHTGNDTEVDRLLVEVRKLKEQMEYEEASFKKDRNIAYDEIWRLAGEVGEGKKIIKQLTTSIETNLLSPQYNSESYQKLLGDLKSHRPRC
jgi:chromosome segregation ATPase